MMEVMSCWLIEVKMVEVLVREILHHLRAEGRVYMSWKILETAYRHFYYPSPDGSSSLLPPLSEDSASNPWVWRNHKKERFLTVSSR